MIPKVSEKDFTLYECFAWNAVGNASATMEIRKCGIILSWLTHPVLVILYFVITLLNTPNCHVI